MKHQKSAFGFCFWVLSFLQFVRPFQFLFFPFVAGQEKKGKKKKKKKKNKQGGVVSRLWCRVVCVCVCVFVIAVRSGGCGVDVHCVCDIGCSTCHMQVPLKVIKVGIQPLQNHHFGR